jgi:amidase
VPGALKGARLGVIRTLFGNAPEDEEVTRAINKSLDALKQAGAHVVDVSIPGLDDLLRDSSVINAEFKFDLADYLSRYPDAPVKSLGEILDRGLYHLALEGTFRARNGVEKRGLDAERRARVKRIAIRDAVIAVLDEHQLSALVYPTLRRKPARLGDAQGGTNCSLSAHSGLPALGVPAAWTDDGLPVGMDVLGRPWSETQLLSIGLGVEETLKLRRAPFSTPPLVDGKAPAPVAYHVGIAGGTTVSDLEVSLKLEYDRTTGRLNYDANVQRGRDSVVAIWLHRGTKEKPGAAVHQLLSAPQSRRSNTVTLSYADRRDLEAGRMLARIFTNRGTTIDLPVEPLPGSR